MPSDFKIYKFLLLYIKNMIRLIIFNSHDMDIWQSWLTEKRQMSKNFNYDLKWLLIFCYLVCTNRKWGTAILRCEQMRPLDILILYWALYT